MVVQELLDSWEDDATIRDVASGRYVDNSKIHHIKHAGAFFTVRGPLVTPRPPQGQPPIAVRLDTTVDSIRLAAAVADIVFLPVDLASDEQATRRHIAASVAQLGAQARSAGRSRGNLAVLASATIAEGDDAAAVITRFAGYEDLDGVEMHSRPERLRKVVEAVASNLTRAGAPSEGRGYPSLRERLGLARPGRRYAAR